ncbi:SH3 domain-containing protein [Qipengyuania sp. MTN3-11]|uniref:SH3 domain-containing protein n=1 Tax=Qipengyuania sp. MTN3-11 TaxID=3056557 RepID=UPI0036F37676
MHRFSLILGLILAMACAGPASAQDREVPYWASIRASELNMRVGPSADYKISWVYRRPGLPVQVVRVHEGWRLIRDPAGDQGWVAARLLSPDRSAMVVGEGLVSMQGSPSSAGAPRWRLEPGVVGRLGDCDGGWCELDVDGRRGWVSQARLWGTDGS